MKKSKFIIMLSLILCFMLVFTLTSCTTNVNEAAPPVNEDSPVSEEDDSPLYKPGTYEGSAFGMMGLVNVEVTFSENEILSVKVTSHAETNLLAELPVEIIPQNIIEYQTLKVDVVSGATLTSSAVLRAVTDCVKQAGGDVDLLRKAEIPKIELASKETIVLNTDVVIIGAGGAGLSASVSVGEIGADAIIIEKTPFVGGATALSSGLVNMAETPKQKELGIPDTIELLTEETYEIGEKLGDYELVSIFASNSTQLYEWFEGYGIEWSDKVNAKPGEFSLERNHGPVVPENYPYNAGQVFTDLLKEVTIDQYGNEILLSTKATELIVEDNKVVGVKAENTINGQKYEVRGKSVIIATGGFAGNPVMAREFDKTIPRSADYYAPSASSGDGIVMAQAVGAETVHMDLIKSILSRQGVTRDVTNAIFVNEDGGRFHDETDSGQNIIAPFNEQKNGHAYMIYDSLTVGEETPKVKAMLESRTLFSADTLEELAEQIGVNPDGLVQSVNEFNEIVTSGKEDPFGRTKFDKTISAPPYYAAERHVQVHYTMGGIRIDKDTHVLDTDGNIISGLFAAGETTGGIHGSYRVGGSALTECFVFGRLAGINAAKEALD